jgi:putative membrane protein
MWGCENFYSSQWGSFSAHWIFGVFLMVIVLLLLGIFLRGFLKASRTRFNDRDDSLQIIKHRFANGDITHETYLEMKKIINQS